jgi:alkylation response protein AidB-like acyl-CoA dehydrogenase
LHSSSARTAAEIYAHLCDYGLVVARTNVDVPKHRGLSMFVVPLDLPGVEVRPLRQLTGNADFNEVFFSDVRLAADALVGEVDDGWRVATTMLMHERVSIGSGRVGGVTHARADALIELARRHGRADDQCVRQRLASVYTHEITASLLALATHAAREAGRSPGPGGSLGKLKGAIVAAAIREVTFELLGPDATAWETDEGGLQVERALTSIGASIAGGTNEIQRNIIGERVLGLPAEPSVDKNVPFKDVAVSRLRV